MKKRIIYTILFISLIINTSILFLATDFYIPKRQVIQCQAVLGNAILKEVNLREKGNDTIFLVKERYFMNECPPEMFEQNSFLNSFKRKFSELSLAISEPYIININQTYVNILNFGDRKIITGDVSGYGSSNNFTSEIIDFEIKPGTNKRKIYDIKYKNVKEDEITISIYDEIKKEEKYNFTFELNGENCRLKS